MKILLITTPTRIDKPNYILPCGIVTLAAFIEKHGHLVNIIDAAKTRDSSQNIIAQIKKFNPDLIGIGGIITAYKYIVNITKAIKKVLPEIPIVIGGQVTVNNTDNCFNHMDIDYLIHGYGEIPLFKLIEYLCCTTYNLNEIPGLAYRENERIIENSGREFVKDINTLPLPAYHLVDMEHYTSILKNTNHRLDEWIHKRGKKKIDNYRFISIMGALGCAAKCTFCIHEQEYVGIRFYSDEYIINHVSLLYHKYNVRVLAIGEEMFIANIKKIKRISKLLTENFPDLYWRTSTRANYVTQELINTLDSEDCNCYSIGYGFESGSQKILDLMNKDVSRKQNINAFKLIEHSKYLRVACSFMVGNVGEDNTTIKDTIQAIHEAGIYEGPVFFTQPYPGGRIWDWAVERGIIKNTHDYLMQVSNKDAAGNLNTNLTPYPDWIVKSMYILIITALKQENRKRGTNKPSAFALQMPVPSKKQNILIFWFLGGLRKIKYNILSFQRAYFPIVMGLPVFYKLLKLIVDVYFMYFNASIKVFTNKKTCTYSLNIDNKGILLPDKLRKGCLPQRVPLGDIMK